MTESITSTNKPKKTLQLLLKRRETFLVRNLETLQPHGLNYELSSEWLYPDITLFKMTFVKYNIKFYVKYDVKFPWQWPSTNGQN